MSISTHIRLRPVRFAFLVRPNDKERVHEIFQINTCLWGGMYNPIVPYIKSVPKWWDRHNHHFETAEQIINGYLDFFEPDFLVEAEVDLADEIGFEEERVLQLSDVLTRGRDWKKGHGLNILDLYRDLYRKEYQFSKRHKHNIINAIHEKHSFRAFSSCLFGGFPGGPGLEYLEQAFIDAFDPKEVLLNGGALADIYRSGCTSALRMGHSKIEVSYHEHIWDPILFVLDACMPRDLIDFWNLRAIRRQIIPVPIQWLDDLSTFCKEYIVKNYRPLPGNNNGVMTRATVMFARSIPTDDIDHLYAAYFQVDEQGANVRQDWYPSIWSPSPRYTVREMRPTLTAIEKKLDLPYDYEKPVLRFNYLHPEFVEKYGNNDRWVNVIEFQDWTSKNQIATAFPCDYKKPLFPNLRQGKYNVLSTTEGFVVIHDFCDAPAYFNIDDGTTAINKWLKANGVEA
ncbi:MAG: hypothetical protein Q9M24_06060, partial [Mariprofundaceae bacterium]|nr:hypothetical protein [Mariprofundaceae bacterium]